MKPVMTQNKFLRKLPETILEKFDQHAELVQIVRGRGDNERESRVDFIYFPVTCVYSLEMPMADGCTSHLGLLGYRDAIGARNLIDLNLPGVPRVILSGYAIRLRSEIFAAALSRSSDVRCVVHDQFVRMSHSLGVTNACNLRHPLQRRLARWVLNLNYASGLTGFDLTHEELAHFLGVRREAVTEGLARLTQAGVLKNSRGRLEILDISALRSFSCECGQVDPSNLEYVRVDRPRGVERSLRVAGV
jgi:CRP-like cAMP-binding protein